MHHFWRIVEEGRECQREIYSYLFADRTKVQANSWQVLVIMPKMILMSKQIVSYICEKPHNTFFFFDL